MKPRIFFASSKEGLGYANELKKILANDYECKLWTDGIFSLSTTTLDALCDAAQNNDFGVFIFSPDDLIDLRGKRLKTTRDNVIFELGLFMGTLGAKRGFLVLPTGINNFRIPTDLDGITYTKYNQNDFFSSPAEAMLEAAENISHSIKTNPHFHRLVDINLQIQSISSFQRALVIEFTNHSNSPVVIRLKGFKKNKLLDIHPRAKININTNRFELKFPTLSDVGTSYGSVALLLEIGSSTHTFVPLDATKQKETDVQTLELQKKLGELFFTCNWLEPNPLVKIHKIKL